MAVTAGTYSYRNIWKVAYPILISLVMEQLIGMTDTAFLGRVGEVELGASAIAIVYYMVLFMAGPRAQVMRRPYRLQRETQG